MTNHFSIIFDECNCNYLSTYPFTTCCWGTVFSGRILKLKIIKKMNHYHFVLFVLLLICPHALSKIKSNPESTTQSKDRTGKGKSIIKTDFKNPDLFFLNLWFQCSVFLVLCNSKIMDAPLKQLRHQAQQLTEMALVLQVQNVIIKGVLLLDLVLEVKKKLF